MFRASDWGKLIFACFAKRHRKDIKDATLGLATALSPKRMMLF